MKINKKGELTTQQIVILIVLIISFVVILYFLFRLNITESSEKEICHNSVIIRGNSILSKGDVPLNCKRTYVCLTKDGSCEFLTNPIIKKVSSKEEVYEVLANEMADCWWMFGEGKIDYIGDKSAEKNYCSICTQLAFDNSLREIEDFNSGKISQDEFYYEYLAKTPIAEEKETYAEYFFGTRDIQSILEGASQTPENLESVNTFGHINLNERYFVIMGITSEIGSTYKWIGGAVVLVSFFIPGANLVTGAIVFSAGVGTFLFGDNVAESLFEPKIAAITVKGEGIKNKFMVPTIIEARSETFQLLNCKDVLTLA